MTFLNFVGPWQLIIILTSLVAIGFSIYALVDILSSRFQGNDKIVWLIVVLFLNFFGALLYFLIGRKQKI